MGGGDGGLKRRGTGEGEVSGVGKRRGRGGGKAVRGMKHKVLIERKEEEVRTGLIISASLLERFFGG